MENEGYLDISKNPGLEEFGGEGIYGFGPDFSQLDPVAFDETVNAERGFENPLYVQPSNTSVGPTSKQPIPTDMV